ncbi:hypothetical protein AYI69_g9737, partial [Smittium culicis]
MSTQLLEDIKFLNSLTNELKIFQKNLSLNEKDSLDSFEPSKSIPLFDSDGKVSRPLKISCVESNTYSGTINNNWFSINPFSYFTSNSYSLDSLVKSDSFLKKDSPENFVHVIDSFDNTISFSQPSILKNACIDDFDNTIDYFEKRLINDKIITLKSVNSNLYFALDSDKKSIILRIEEIVKLKHIFRYFNFIDNEGYPINQGDSSISDKFSKECIGQNKMNSSNGLTEYTKKTINENLKNSSNKINSESDNFEPPLIIDTLIANGISSENLPSSYFNNSNNLLSETEYSLAKKNAHTLLYSIFSSSISLSIDGSLSCLLSPSCVLFWFPLLENLQLIDVNPNYLLGFNSHASKSITSLTLRYKPHLDLSKNQIYKQSTELEFFMFTNIPICKNIQYLDIGVQHNENDYKNKSKFSKTDKFSDKSSSILSSSSSLSNAAKSTKTSKNISLTTNKYNSLIIDRKSTPSHNTKGVTSVKISPIPAYNTFHDITKSSKNLDDDSLTFKNKVESIRKEVGSSWLRVFSEIKSEEVIQPSSISADSIPINLVQSNAEIFSPPNLKYTPDNERSGSFKEKNNIFNQAKKSIDVDSKSFKNSHSSNETHLIKNIVLLKPNENSEKNTDLDSDLNTKHFEDSADIKAPIEQPMPYFLFPKKSGKLNGDFYSNSSIDKAFSKIKSNLSNLSKPSYPESSHTSEFLERTEKFPISLISDKKSLVADSISSDKDTISKKETSSFPSDEKDEKSFNMSNNSTDIPFSLNRYTISWADLDLPCDEKSKDSTSSFLDKPLRYSTNLKLNVDSCTGFSARMSLVSDNYLLITSMKNTLKNEFKKNKFSK